MKFQQIELRDIDKFKDCLLIVEWETGSLMPMEYGQYIPDGEDTEIDTWGYIEPGSLSTYTLNVDEDPELIKSIYVCIK